MISRIKGNYHPIKEANIKKGDEAEDRLTTTFKNYFCNDLIKDPNPYAIMDYYCDCCLVELKSRNIKKNTYETTMVGMNKINYSLKSKKMSFFVFEFTDGLFYWVLNKEDLKTFEQKKGGTSKRGEIEEKDYLYIPVNKLIKLEPKNNPPASGCCIIEKVEEIKEIINKSPPVIFC